VVRHQGQLFIMEFKATTSKDHNKVAEEAMAQIKDRGYADQYKTCGNQGHLMALVFSKGKRNIGKVLVKKVW
ncbi:MAG: PD-(D/E)XK nuclease domain-containing protein, partial [Proteobacteria bacterium]|nr:PD-(D/E)XK nuclease domain-containing protein [Pseudomonadota bacterium]